MPQDDRIRINANIEISGQTLQKIVHMGKKLTGPDGRGHFRIDTADLVADLISRFLTDRGFDAYVADARHYEALLSNRKPGGEK